MTTTSIVVNVALSLIAFGAAKDSENAIKRALGLSFLIARGLMLFARGLLFYTAESFTVAGIIPTLIGIAMLALAGLAWWHNRA